MDNGHESPVSERNPELGAHAAELERLMPQIARRLFTLDVNDPASNLPVSQLRVCSVLQSGPATMSALAEELHITLSAVTQIADRLERAGLVERVSEHDDRRMKKLVLTAHGAAVMRARLERRTNRAAAALSKLARERRVEVLGALRELLAATTAPTDEPAVDSKNGIHAIVK